MASILMGEKQEAIIPCFVDGTSIRAADVTFQHWTVADLIAAALTD